MSFKPGEGFHGKYMSPDPLQQKWDDPSELAKALYVHDRFMVRPDDRPVAPHHVMVIAREEVPVEGLDFAEQQALWALVMVTHHHMTEVLQPSRKVAVTMWGNMVKTGHMHLVPRNHAEDATIWQPMHLEPHELAAQLDETRQLLAFPPEVTAQANFVVDQTLQRLGGVRPHTA